METEETNNVLPFQRDRDLVTIHGVEMALGHFSLERLLHLEDSLAARIAADMADLQVVIGFRQKLFPDGSGA